MFTLTCSHQNLISSCGCKATALCSRLFATTSVGQRAGDLTATACLGTEVLPAHTRRTFCTHEHDEASTPKRWTTKQWQTLLPPSLLNTIYLLQPYQTEHSHHDGILSPHNSTLRQEPRLEVRRRRRVHSAQDPLSQGESLHVFRQRRSLT